MTNPFAKAPLASSETEDVAEGGLESVLVGGAVDSDTAKQEKDSAGSKGVAKKAAAGGKAGAATVVGATSVESEENGAAPNAKKLTPAQERDKLRAEVVALREQIEAEKARAIAEADIEVVRDSVLIEDGIGGQTRVLADGATVISRDWRLTQLGLVVMVGRASAQANTSFKIPVSLVASLHELLGAFIAHTEQK